MESLNHLLKKLKSSARVDAVFVTGSFADKSSTENSDLDLIVILKKNETGIRSVYEKNDGVFADIFFYDNDQLLSYLRTKKMYAGGWDGMFISWLNNSEIKFDKTGTLTKLREVASDILLEVSEHKKNEIHNQISYNFIQNQRYFNSHDPKYLDALEIRLMYSVVDLLTGFLELRDEPWRGEKKAIEYLKNNHSDFYNLFREYGGEVELGEKMKIYSQMVRKVIPGDIDIIKYDTPLALSKNENTDIEMMRQKDFWESIVK